MIDEVLGNVNDAHCVRHRPQNRQRLRGSGFGCGILWSVTTGLKTLAPGPGDVGEAMVCAIPLIRLIRKVSRRGSGLTRGCSRRDLQQNTDQHML